MIFQHFRLDIPSIETNAFVIGCEETREAMLIDAGIFSEAIKAFLFEHSLRLSAIFITHNHWDHTDGLADALSAWPEATVYHHTDSVAGVRAHALKQGHTMALGSITGRIVETPGHTPDGISLILEETPACPGMAFTGDALFAGSVGGTSNPRDYEIQLDAIRKNLFGLPGHYEIHVGHGASSTIAVEREFNPFFVRMAWE